RRCAPFALRRQTVGARSPDRNGLDFLHFFRFARREGVGVQAQRRGFDQQTRQPLMQPFFPEPAGGLTHHPDGKGTLGDLLDAMLRTGTSLQEAELWWREIFVSRQLLPFAALFIDRIPPDETTLLLYRLRNFF